MFIFGTVVGISYFTPHIQRKFSGIELLKIGEGEYEILQMTNICIDAQVRYGMFAAFPRFDGAIEVSSSVVIFLVVDKTKKSSRQSTAPSSLHMR